MTDLDIISTLTTGDVITYNSSTAAASDRYTSIVVSCIDGTLCLIDIESTNRVYTTPQGYTYGDYEESVLDNQLCNITKINHIDLLGYLSSQLPEYFI